MPIRFLSLLCLLVPLAAASGEQPAPKPDAPKQTSGFDTGYAWDQFDHRGRVMWACRDIKTGEIVANELCEFMEKTDTQWPGKATPESWRGSRHYFSMR